ncbi:MAG: hypothetical protein Q8N23_12195 [Archangium sp.]|nr:hypothetical protein [Archangium sp.]MDP3573413.1 hypothetical protein [Archangium sp.]
MHSVTVLGPLLLDESWIAAISVGGKKLNSKVLDTREEAVAWVVNKLPSGAQVTCDTALSDLATSRGWTVGPLPEPMLRDVAIAILDFLHEPHFRKITDPEIFVELLGAVAAFARAQPWRRFDGEPHELRLTGSTSGSRVALVSENDPEFSLSLFETLADADRFLELSEDDDEGAFEVDSFKCTLEFEPNAVTQLMERVFGTAFDPAFLLLKNEKPQPIRVDDLRILTATLRAFTAVGSVGDTGTGACELIGKRVEARVEVELPEVPPPSRLPGPQKNPFHTLGEQVTPRLFEVGLSTPGWAEAREGSPDRELATMLSIFVHPVGKQTVAARLLETELPEDVRRWVQAVQGGRLALCEIEALGDGGQVCAFDLLLNESVLIEDLSLSRALPHSVGLLWLVEVEGVALVLASTDRPLELREGLELRDTLRTASWSHAVLRDPARVTELLAAYREKQRSPSAAGALNTDGEPVAFGIDRYALRANPEAAADLIAVQPDAFETEDFLFTVCKRGNATFPGWWRTMLFELEINDKVLLARANSLVRLDAARQWLSRALGDRLSFVERRVDERPVPSLGQPLDLQPVLTGPWAAVLPTLDLQAALPSSEELRTNEKARRETHLTLARHQRENESGVVSFSVRRRLGLSLRGEWIGPDSLWVAMGAGIPLSLALQSLTAPVLTELEGGEHTVVSDGVRLAWAAWSSVKACSSLDEAIAAARKQLTPSPAAPKSTGAALSPEIPRESPNLTQVLEAVPWAIKRVQLYFSQDQRVVKEVRIARLEEHISCEAFWAPDAALEKTLKPLGYELGETPLNSFEDLTLESEFAWRTMPPAWRWELAADHVRRLPDFGPGLDEHIAAHVAMADRLLIERDVALRGVWEKLHAGAPGSATTLLTVLYQRCPDLMAAGKLTEAMELLAHQRLSRS